MQMGQIEVKELADGCCSHTDNMEGRCHKSATTEKQTKKDECPISTTENSCVCICFFQYAAPEQVFLTFNLQENRIASNYNLSPDPHLTDPLVAAPWQPPDIS